jgi:CubicO group peptidase (beta-lactamase class C family)/lysophospholipase L1-like esterase
MPTKEKPMHRARRSGLFCLVALLLLVPVAPVRAESAKTAPVRILLLGDSTVIGSICRREAPKADHLEDVIRKLLAAETDLPPVEVINQGRDGDSIQGLLSGRYDREIATLPRVDIVLIRYGLNDHGSRENFAANFPKDYRELIRRLKENHPGCQVVLETVIPYRGEQVDKQINDLVREVANAEKLPLLDTHARYAAELKHGPDMLNYRRVKLDKVPVKLRALLPPAAVRGNDVVLMDNSLDAHFRGVPGWFADRHPNLAGYHVIGDEAARFLALFLREKHLREVTEARVTFGSPVFASETFPACDFEQPARMRELIGPYRVKICYYNRERQAVEKAEKQGIYGAVVEVIPEKGRSLHCDVTLFRLNSSIDSAARIEADDLTLLAKRGGIRADVCVRQRDLIGQVLKGRTAGEWARDTRAAQLLAGLSLDPAPAGTVHKYDDAFALERQWWVGLKRQLAGLDKTPAKAFVCPRPVAGAAAPVLREGSEAEAGFKPGTVDQIDAVCKEWAAKDDQAFAICIARKGVILIHRAYGQRDGQPMTVNTKSWMASITKTMSASLMMMLVDQGLVDLDDRIDKYIPALRNIKVETPLTIRHLYTHTNGLHRWPGWNDEMPDLEEHVADYYHLLKVGEGFGYNGVGYELGGKIIENLTGEAIPQFFHNHLLEPLGCEHTDVVGTHADAFSVPLDIARFGQMLLNRGSYGKLQFFRAETFEKMLPRKLTKVLGADTTKTFGIGLDGQPMKFGHGAASAATFLVDRENDLVVIMTRNKYGKVQDKYNGKFWDAIQNNLVK